MPNLTKFSDFAKPWLEAELERNATIYEGSKRAIDLIVNRLAADLKSPLGRSLDGSSSFDINVDFLVLSLTDVSSSKDSLLYAMAGLQIITRKAVLATHSKCFVEETTTLYRMPPFAQRISALPPTARKLGMNCTFIFQSIAEAFQTTYGAQIFNNIQNVMLLKATEGIVKEVVEHLGFRKEMADTFIGNTISPKTLESRLYLKRGQKHIPLTHIPSILHLALAATDTEEVEARHRCRSLYGDPENPADISWLVKFAELYAEAKRRGFGMDTICPSGLKRRMVAA
jgi:type IV secretory pathway VirB4 component